MAKLEIADFVKFEVSLEEIIDACRLLLKNSKDEQVRTALKSMFGELQRGSAALIRDVLLPLFEMETQGAFQRKFGKVRTAFKGFRLHGKGFMSEVHCGIVINKLNELKQGQAWKKYVPLVNRSIVRLELAVDNWIANDAELYQADQRMMTEINAFLDDIAATKASNPAKAFSELKDGLTSIEDSFVRTRKHLADLKALSARL